MDTGLEPARKTDLRSLDTVTLISDLMHEGRVIPAGTRGTVVHIYADRSTAEVEFETPTWCVITLKTGQVH